MATGGEESELTSSTPTRSSGKRKAAAVKKWRNQKNVGGAGKKEIRSVSARSSEMFHTQNNEQGLGVFGYVGCRASAQS